MKTGLNTLLWGGAFTDQTLNLLAKVRNSGYQIAEIPLFDPAAVTPAKVRAAAEKIGVGLAICHVVPPDANPISPKAAVRKNAAARFKKILKTTHDLGAHLIAGPVYSPVGTLVGRGRTRQEWNWCVQFYKAVMPMAEDLGVTLAIEPINRFETYFMNLVDDVLEMIGDAGSPNLKLHADTFHMNIEEKDSPAAIRRAGKNLGHFHISESDRGVPGTGQVDWEGCFKALRAIGYEGCLATESFNGSIKELAAATSIWRRIAPSQEAIAKGALDLIKKLW